jgi:hypothetical protein
MRKHITLMTMLLAALALTFVVVAQDTGSSTVTGKITSVDTVGGTFTVDTSTGAITLNTDASTMYMSRGQTVRINDLKVGDRVSVTATGSGNTRTATNVDVLPATSSGSQPPGVTSSNTKGGSEQEHHEQTYENRTGSTAYKGEMPNRTGSTATEGQQGMTHTAEKGHLPKTASPLPAIALLGVSLFGASLAFRAARRIPL